MAALGAANGRQVTRIAGALYPITVAYCEQHRYSSPRVTELTRSNQGAACIKYKCEGKYMRNSGAENMGRALEPRVTQNLLVYCENEASYVALSTVLNQAARRGYYNNTVATLHQLAQTGNQAGRIHIGLFNSGQITAEAAGLTQYVGERFVAISLQTQDYSRLMVELTHEFGHGCLRLCNPHLPTNSAIHETFMPKLKAAFFADYRAFRANPVKLVPIQQEVYRWIFQVPAAYYPRSEQFAESICFMLQSMAHDARAARSVAPRFYAAVEEYVRAEASIPVLAGGARPAMPAAISNVVRQNAVVSASYRHFSPALEHNPINWRGLGRGALGVLGVGMTLYDINNRMDEAIQRAPNASFAQHCLPVARGLVYDWGTFAAIAANTGALAAMGITLPVTLLSELANGVRYIEPEDVQHNRDLFFAAVVDLDVSPEAEMKMLDAFDRGEEWTRRFTANTATVVKQQLKPFEILYDVREDFIHGTNAQQRSNQNDMREIPRQPLAQAVRLAPSLTDPDRMTLDFRVPQAPRHPESWEQMGQRILGRPIATANSQPLTPLRDWRDVQAEAGSNLPRDGYGNILFVGADGIARKASEIKVQLVSPGFKNRQQFINSPPKHASFPLMNPNGIKKPDWLKGVGITADLEKAMVTVSMALSWETFGGSLVVLGIVKGIQFFKNKSERHKIERRNRNDARVQAQCDEVFSDVEKSNAEAQKAVTAFNAYQQETDPVRREQLRIAAVKAISDAKALNESCQNTNNNRINNKHAVMPSGSSHEHQVRHRTRNYCQKVNDVFAQNVQLLASCGNQMTISLPFDQLSGDLRKHFGTSVVVLNQAVSDYQEGLISETEFVRAMGAFEAEAKALSTRATALGKEHQQDNTVKDSVNTVVSDLQKEMLDLKLNTQKNIMVRSLAIVEKTLENETLSDEDRVVIRGALEKFNEQWQGVTDKKSQLFLLQHQAAVAFYAEEYAAVRNAAENILQLQPDNFHATQLWIRSSINLDKPQSEIVAKIAEFKAVYQEAKQQGILLYYEGFLTNDLKIIANAFDQLKQASGMDVTRMMQNCFDTLIREDQEKRYVLSEIAHKELNTELLLQDKLVDLMKSQLVDYTSIQEEIKQLDETMGPLTAEDLKRKADLANEAKEYEKGIKDNGVILRSNIKVLASKEARADLQNLCLAHLGVEVIQDVAKALGISEAIAKKCGSETPEADVRAVSTIAGRTFSLFENLQSDKVKRLEQVCMKDMVTALGDVDEKGKAALQLALDATKADDLNALESFFANQANHLLIARLGESVIDFTLQKIYQHSQHGLGNKRISFEAWVNQSWTRWIVVQSSRGMSFGLDTGSTVEMLNSVYRKFDPSTFSMPDGGMSIVKLFVQAPIFSRFLLDTLDGNKIVTTNSTRLFIGCFVRNMNSSAITRYAGHGQTIARLGAWILSGAAAYTAANSVLAKVVPGLNYLFAANCAYQLYATMYATMPKELVDRKFHNFQVEMNRATLEMLQCGQDAARLNSQKIIAKNLFRRIKNEIKDMMGKHPDAMKLYLNAMFAEHCTAGEVVHEQLSGDGNGLFLAVSCYTRETAPQLREMAVNYISQRQGFFKILSSAISQIIFIICATMARWQMN